MTHNYQLIETSTNRSKLFCDCRIEFDTFSVLRIDQMCCNRASLGRPVESLKSMLEYEVIWGILVFWLLLLGGYLGGGR